MGTYLTRGLPIVASLMLLGCIAHFLIHWSHKVAEKTWAMLATWLTYMGMLLYVMVHNITDDATATEGDGEWVLIIFSIFLLILPSFIFFSGDPGFFLYASLCIIGITFYVVNYFVAAVDGI